MIGIDVSGGLATSSRQRASLRVFHLIDRGSTVTVISPQAQWMRIDASRAGTARLVVRFVEHPP